MVKKDELMTIPSTYATQKTGLEAKPRPRPVSEVLDPEFCVELQANAKAYDATQENADNSTWEIARIVNSLYEEHKTQFKEKRDYYKECSRVANIGLRKKRFSESGETLRKWCDIQFFWGRFSTTGDYLDLLSFNHLVIGRKLFRDGKVKFPLDCLRAAVKDGLTADEMKERFDPEVSPYEGMTEQEITMKQLEFRSNLFMVTLDEAMHSPSLGVDPEKYRQLYAALKVVKELAPQVMRKPAEGKSAE